MIYRRVLKYLLGVLFFWVFAWVITQIWESAYGLINNPIYRN